MIELSDETLSHYIGESALRKLYALHALGPRAVASFIIELGVAGSARSLFEERITLAACAPRADTRRTAMGEK
jgi:hypothetical protein